MKKSSKIILYISAFLSFLMIIGTFSFSNNMPTLAYIIIQFINFSLLLGILLFNFYQFESLIKLAFTFNIMMFIMLAGYIAMDVTGVFDRLSNMELIKNFILGTGFWGMGVYIGVQIIQVVFLPLPSIIINLVGVALYGPTVAFLLSTLGVFLGSVIAFGLGRIFGSKLVEWIVGKDKAMEYRMLLSNKGKYMLFLMLLFPLFPDDILCMVAGLTTMSWRYFIIVVLLTRPITIAVMCYMGTGEIIPFTGWGIAVWIAIFAGFMLLFYFLNKYKSQIINWITRLFKKKKIRSRPNKKYTRP